MILYHFPTSPVARRVRLALALKSLLWPAGMAGADAFEIATTSSRLADGGRVSGC
ncbi:MAG TPA: glutathione S-transferase N-terminal domain-containing protein [Polyangiaceae bacterium]|nr:glutathione S-transferase N-terminal domain-containing protein [Polyangiaceae bacterium]